MSLACDDKREVAMWLGKEVDMCQTNIIHTIILNRYKKNNLRREKLNK